MTLRETPRLRHPRRIRPIVDSLEDRRLLSLAVVDVANDSSYTITANFRWTPSSNWTQFTEKPGQGELFWNNYSNTLTPQVLVNTTSVAGNQTTYTLSEGYGQWAGTGTPPASAASVYQFQNHSAGSQVIQLAYGSAPQIDQVDHPGAAYSYSVVNQPLFGANGPSYRDVLQGADGDCWLMASLAEVAARDPQDIRNMFTADGTTSENGTIVSLYSVRLYNASGTPEYVTVDNELPAGGTYYDRANGVLWAALAEKAYAQANGYGYVNSSSPGGDSYNAINSGLPNWALQAITGKSSSGFSFNPSNVAAAWEAGDLIVIGSNSSLTNADIVNGHAYAVVNYNPSSSQPFQVYNPWGTNASGWVLDGSTGTMVYGLFNASGTFLSQNYSQYFAGLGGADEANGPAVGPVEPGSSTILDAPTVTLGRPSSSISQGAAVTITPANKLVAMSPTFARKMPVQASTMPIAWAGTSTGDETPTGRTSGRPGSALRP